jgi:hypothetical protein
MLTKNRIWFGTIHSYQTLHKQAYLIVWVKGPEMRCVLCSMLVYHPMISRSTKNGWIFNHIPGHLQYISLHFQSYFDAFSILIPGQLYINAFSIIFPGQQYVNAFSIIFPGQLNINAFSIIFPGQLYIDAFSIIFPGQLYVDGFSTTVVSQSTLNQWLSNTLAISPSKPNINAYSIIKITIDYCCSNVVAININNISFHRYGNGDPTFILHWNFNVNHNEDSDGKSIFIQCWLAVLGRFLIILGHVTFPFLCFARPENTHIPKNISKGPYYT